MAFIEKPAFDTWNEMLRTEEVQALFPRCSVCGRRLEKVTLTESVMTDCIVVAVGCHGAAQTQDISRLAWMAEGTYQARFDLLKKVLQDMALWNLGTAVDRTEQTPSPTTSSAPEPLRKRKNAPWDF